MKNTYSLAQNIFSVSGLPMEVEVHKKMFGFLGEAMEFRDGTLWIFDYEEELLYVRCDLSLDRLKAYILETSYAGSYPINNLEDLDNIRLMPKSYQANLNLAEYWNFSSTL